ncbi:MAG: hypothetical protein LUF86_06685, partial [Clostridiales bacterium]|nr:hypothetical protein [Clostridiales bacterium]
CGAAAARQGKHHPNGQHKRNDSISHKTLLFRFITNNFQRFGAKRHLFLSLYHNKAYGQKKQ